MGVLDGCLAGCLDGCLKWVFGLKTGMCCSQVFVFGRHCCLCISEANKKTMLTQLCPGSLWFAVRTWIYVFNSNVFSIRDLK